MTLEDRPNSIPWPPMLFIGAAALALIVHWNAPLPFPAASTGTILKILGLCMVVAAIAIDVLAVQAFRRHRTTIMPHKGADTLITSGIFAVSRNPIYVGNFLLLAGAGFLSGIWAMVIAAPIALFATRQLAVLREEKHLAARFGAAWQSYCRSTRRWL